MLSVIFWTALVTVVVVSFPLMWFYENALSELDDELTASARVVRDAAAEINRLQDSNQALRLLAIDQRRMIDKPFDSHAREAVAVAQAEANVVAFPDLIKELHGDEEPRIVSSYDWPSHKS